MGRLPPAWQIVSFQSQAGIRLLTYLRHGVVEALKKLALDTGINPEQETLFLCFLAGVCRHLRY
jgi:hypothetical protein